MGVNATPQANSDDRRKLQLEEGDARRLEEDAHRCNISKEDLIKQIVEEMTPTLQAGSATHVTPDELVFAAVRTFVAKQKGQR
jgi:hypothetical protein